MERKHKKREPNLKFKVAIEAVKGVLSISQIASKYSIHPKQVTDWRDQLLADGQSLFLPKTSLKRTKTDLEKDALYKILGELTAENKFLKKKLEK